MKILMVIISFIILLIRFIMPAYASEYKNSSHKSLKARINTMKHNLMCNDITEKIRLTDEQKKSLQALADELKETRKRVAKELNENKKKVDIALSKSNGRAEAEQLLAKDNETIASLHKNELDIIEKIHAVLDEIQKKRLQRMRENRIDEEQENSKMDSSDNNAFFFSHNNDFADNGLPTVLPEEESALLGMGNNSFSSFGNSFTFSFNGKDFHKNRTFNFNMPDMEIPDIEAPDTEMNEDEETPHAVPPKAPKAPHWNKQEKEKLERSMKNLEKKLKEMEKQIQIEIQSEKEDEI